MQRQLAGLAEFALSDSDQTMAGVEIIAVEPDGLSDSHAGNRQQANQTLVGRNSMGCLQGLRYGD